MSGVGLIVVVFMATSETNYDYARRGGMISGGQGIFTTAEEHFPLRRDADIWRQAIGNVARNEIYI